MAESLMFSSSTEQLRTLHELDAHETAHQWFGDLITAQSGKHHWLQEGFATYYALLAERAVFGEDYFYNKLFQSAQQLIQAAKTDSIPVLNPKASSLSFYQKGAWALHVLRENVGEKNFQKAVKSYLEKYSFKNEIKKPIQRQKRLIHLYYNALPCNLYLCISIT